MNLHKIIAVLIIICLFLTGFLIYEVTKEQEKFVIGRTTKYCYQENEVPNTVKVFAKFDSYDECVEFLEDSFMLSR